MCEWAWWNASSNTCLMLTGVKMNYNSQVMDLEPEGLQRKIPIMREECVFVGRSRLFMHS